MWTRRKTTNECSAILKEKTAAEKSPKSNKKRSRRRQCSIITKNNCRLSKKWSQTGKTWWTEGRVGSTWIHSLRSTKSLKTHLCSMAHTVDRRNYSNMCIHRERHLNCKNMEWQSDRRIDQLVCLALSPNLRQKLAASTRIHSRCQMNKRCQLCLAASKSQKLKRSSQRPWCSHANSPYKQ